VPVPTEQPYRRLVAALWVLVRTAGTRGADAQLRAAAVECQRCIVEALGEATHFVLQEHDGALFGNGLRIRPDVAAFAATAGITALLQDNEISELLLLPTAGVDDLMVLGRGWHDPAARGGFEALLRDRGCRGVHVAHRGAPMPVEPTAAPATLAAAPSQLGAVFTMQRFAAAVGPVGPLSAGRARAVLQSVLHRLLRQPAGLEPLARMQRDPQAHAELVRACVLAVRTAEELGWNDERCLAAGIAALLGAAQASDGDAEVAELARAAQAVAALLCGRDGPRQAIERLQLHGELPAFVGAAMEQVLVAST